MQFDFNLLFLFLPNPPGDGQIDWPIKIIMVKISLKNSAHITMFTNRDALDWGLGDQTFVPRAFFFLFFFFYLSKLGLVKISRIFLFCSVKLD